MANYSTIQEAIDAGITNMTVLRNHSRNDDSTSTYATEIDWFKFNNVLVSNIYSSGNSWLGFGTSSEQLRVNRRDCAVWDEYKESGMIGIAKFFKFTWKGTSAYSSSYERVDSYQQYFDVFLFDTGQILLNFFKVPTSSFDGTKQLVCGSQTLSYPVSAGVPCEYTFTPTDPVNGTGWSVGTDRPTVSPYKTSGTATFILSDYIGGEGDSLYWDAVIPSGTDVKMFTKVNNGSYSRINSNGGKIKDLPSGACTLYVKAQLSTDDSYITPKLRKISIRNSTQKRMLILTPNVPNISNAIGNVNVIYDGLGGLQGVGGPTSPFNEPFTPSGLTWKGHQNQVEHIQCTVESDIILTEITYSSGKLNEEHITATVDASLVLTNIHDL